MQAFAAKLGTIPTTVLRLDNMVKATTLLDAQEYSEVRAGTRLPLINPIFCARMSPSSDILACSVWNASRRRVSPAAQAQRDDNEA